MEKKEKIKKINKFFFKKLFLIQFFKKKGISSNILFNKNFYIFKNLKNFFFFVYNGNVFKKIIVREFHFSFNFGNFVFTKKPFKFLIKKKKR